MTLRMVWAYIIAVAAILILGMAADLNREMPNEPKPFTDRVR